MTPEEEDIAFTAETAEGVSAVFALQPSAAPDALRVCHRAAFGVVGVSSIVALARARAAWQTVQMRARCFASSMLALATLPFVACGGRVDGAVVVTGDALDAGDAVIDAPACAGGGAWSASARVTTDDFHGVWGSGPSDVWAVGQSGTIVRWDGSAWLASASGITDDLWGVWGSGPSDVWAVGELGTIVRWNGSAWLSSKSAETSSLWFWSVWGSGPSDVWAVGELGPIVHWNGSAWLAPGTVPPTSVLYGVWGSGPSDVLAVGDGFVHWNGSAWSGIATFRSTALNGVWGSGPSDVWGVGFGGEIGDVGLVMHWNGSAWSASASPTTKGLSGVWGSGPCDVWAVGASGTILHYP